MMSQADKREYGRVVKECLVAFLSMTRREANRRTNFHRALVESKEPRIAGDVFYHLAPFFADYERILVGKTVAKAAGRPAV